MQPAKTILVHLTIVIALPTIAIALKDDKSKKKQYTKPKIKQIG